MNHQRAMEIRQRRQRVKRMVAEGFSEREIASMLKICRTTVWNDKQAMKVPA